MAEFKLNEVGNVCPKPLIDTKNKLKELNAYDVLIVKVDGSMPLENILNYCNGNNLKTDVTRNDAKDIDIKITVTEEFKKSEEKDTGCSCKNDKLVVAIGSDKMGCGSEELGKKLIKAFIFSLSKEEQLPDVILFYNSGAYLTTTGSESLDDLKQLSGAGVKILTCGTCLDFYNLKEKLEIGEVTNMYDIVNQMETATKLLKP